MIRHSQRKHVYVYPAPLATSSIGFVGQWEVNLTNFG